MLLFASFKHIYTEIYYMIGYEISKYTQTCTYWGYFGMKIITFILRYYDICINKRAYVRIEYKLLYI
jgi:hypothetical protein